MRNNLFIGIAVVVGVVLHPQQTIAQDYHLSQFDAVQVMFNPAHTGMTHDKDYRASTLYRNQWRPLAARPFSTFAIAYDMRINDRWGVGGYMINSDGAKIFNSFNLVGSVAYEISDPVQKDFELTVGLQTGMIYRNTKDSELTFDSQYSNGEFDNSLPSLEEFNRFSKVMPEFTLGMAYKMTRDVNVFRPYGGFSLWHLTSPKSAFVEGTDIDSRLPRKFVFNAGGEIQPSDELMFDVKLLAMFQGQATEYMGGFTTTYLLSEDDDTRVGLGLYYRHLDAFIINLGIDYKHLRYYMSYDITTTDLANYNKRMGGLEFTLVYTPEGQHTRTLIDH